MTREEFRSLASEGLLLDGATGSNLIKAGMPRTEHAEDWLQFHPESILALQRAYAEAGSRMVYAPTFTASRAYHDSGIAELNSKMVALSRQAVPGLLVAGDITTVGTNTMESEDMYPIYREQAQALIDSAVDAIVIETMMGLDEAVAAVESARELCDLPLLCSFSIMPDGGFYFGGDLFEAAATLEALGLDAIGVNCSAGPEQLVPIIRRLRSETSLPIIAKPNAGLPEINLRGEAVYSLGAEEFAKLMVPLLDEGASIVGGCCGTTPEHIRALHEAMQSR